MVLVSVSSSRKIANAKSLSCENRSSKCFPITKYYEENSKITWQTKEFSNQIDKIKKIKSVKYSYLVLDSVLALSHSQVQVKFHFWIVYTIVNYIHMYIQMH